MLNKLDRFVYCVSWEDLFLDCSQMALPRTTSDHSSILLDWKNVLRCPLPFKFEEIWFLESDFMDVVEYEWNNVVVSGNMSWIFAIKLKSLKKRLIAWSKSSGDSLKKDLEACRVKIKELDRLEEGRNLSSDENVSRNGFIKNFSFWP